MVHSDTSNGFWTLDPVVYVVSASSDLFEGKIFEFEIWMRHNYIWAE